MSDASHSEQEAMRRARESSDPVDWGLAGSRDRAISSAEVGEREYERAEKLAHELKVARAELAVFRASDAIRPSEKRNP